jgi:hypothetical protein
MRRTLALALGLTMLPMGAHGQVEVGLDAGLALQTGFEVRSSVTTISVPTGHVRIAFAGGETISIETLLSFDRFSSDGSAFSVLSLLPGVNFSFGDGGGYVRGEVGVQRASNGNASQSQYAVGAAVGVKRPLGDSGALLRIEGGFDRWLEDADAGVEGFNQVRALFGVSAVIG